MPTLQLEEPSTAEITAATVAFMEAAQQLVCLTDSGTVLSALAAAYTAFAPGSLVALRFRQIAEEIELTADYLYGKYGC